MRQRQTEVCIRHATTADWPAVRTLIGTVLDEVGLGQDCLLQEADLQAPERVYAEPHGFFAVLVQPDEALVGTVGVRRVDAASCELRRMYLLPAWRAHGLGKAMLDHALSWASQAGYRSVVLDTAAVLVDAIGLYRSRGFERVAGTAGMAGCDQRWELLLNEAHSRPTGNGVQPCAQAPAGGLHDLLE